MPKPKRIGMLILLPIMLLAPTLLNAASSLNSAKVGDTKALLDIVEVAESRVRKTFETLESGSIQVPDEAAKKYEEGLLLAEDASNLMIEEDYNGASSLAVEALEKFQAALGIVHKIIPKTPSEAEVTAERIINLKATVNRTYEYVKRLEHLINNAQNAGYNCSTLKSLIQEAETHLERAYEKLDELDIEGASREVASSKALLNQSLVLYQRLSNKVKLARAESFLTETEKRFSVLNENITALSQMMPEEERNATLVALNEAVHRLTNARVFLEDTQVDETILELVKYRESVKESLRYVQSVQAELEEKS